MCPGMTSLSSAPKALHSSSFDSVEHTTCIDTNIYLLKKQHNEYFYSSFSSFLNRFSVLDSKHSTFIIVTHSILCTLACNIMIHSMVSYIVTALYFFLRKKGPPLLLLD
uniref:Uncharacterized protein n=1 Tax=Chaetoceros debilis TaxID=122233 RepID=A0A7S3V9C2_9STRA